MKRRIGLLICTVIILTAFSGCMVKKEASTTGETSTEITVEITPEITKEPANDSTPEFYDFMTLDPDVDITNEQVRTNILKRIISFNYNNTPTFTKKENYLYEMYEKNYFSKSSRINFYIKLGSKGFYSSNTKKKLNNLGFKFEVSQSSNTWGYPYIYYHIKSPDCSEEEYIKRLEQALIILLQDHNVNYVSISTPAIPN